MSGSWGIVCATYPPASLDEEHPGLGWDAAVAAAWGFELLMDRRADPVLKFHQR